MNYTDKYRSKYNNKYNCYYITIITIHSNHNIRISNLNVWLSLIGRCWLLFSSRFQWFTISFPKNIFSRWKSENQACKIFWKLFRKSVTFERVWLLNLRLKISRTISTYPSILKHILYSEYRQFLNYPLLHLIYIF